MVLAKDHFKNHLIFVHIRNSFCWHFYMLCAVNSNDSGLENIVLWRWAWKRLVTALISAALYLCPIWLPLFDRFCGVNADDWQEYRGLEVGRTGYTNGGSKKKCCSCIRNEFWHPDVAHSFNHRHTMSYNLDRVTVSCAPDKNTSCVWMCLCMLNFFWRQRWLCQAASDWKSLLKAYNGKPFLS